MNQPIVISIPHLDHPLNIVIWRDQPTWLALEVGSALGYANRGRRLVSLIQGEWDGRLIQGVHYISLCGDELEAYQRHVAETPAKLSRVRDHLVLLTNPGMEEVLRLCREFLLVSFRRHLQEQAVPALAALGFTLDVSLPDVPAHPDDEDDDLDDDSEEHSYLDLEDRHRRRDEGLLDEDREEPTADLLDPPRALGPRPDLQMHMSIHLGERAELAARVVDLAERWLRSRTMRMLGLHLQRAGRIGERGVAAFEEGALRTALGEHVPVPPYDPIPRGWMTLAQLASTLVESPFRVQMAALTCGLVQPRRGLVLPLLRTTSCFPGWRVVRVYSPKAQAWIIRELDRRGSEGPSGLSDLLDRGPRRAS